MSVKLQPWARHLMTHDEIQWSWRPMEKWQADSILKQCEKYKTIVLKWIKGFTLVELMIAIAVLSILVAIAAPNLRRAIRHAKESSTKASLNNLRNALSRYVIEHENIYPSNLDVLVTQHYISKIPTAHTPPHKSSGNSVQAGRVSDQLTSTAHWFYFLGIEDGKQGQVIVNCDKTTLQGRRWDSL